MITLAHTPLQKALLSLVQETQKISCLIELKAAATILKTSMKKVQVAAEDMGLNVNVGIGGPGGYGTLPRAKWSIEDLNAPYHE